ncbi:hypothetical protein [Halanaerobacter jeridensis]|uniref:Uncharacterized protein n=1 Tax=Halanaerobacter jeridensis TaxID=706427 RepID=A0A938XRB8_9FIRM|nr:hypothetical protein [Halanaerobacter jeridensis]MBM7556216.1 hypothetical protein [Halanaerobacter jeridensis]
MFNKKRLLLVIAILVLGIVFTGCSGDSAVTELTEDVDGPPQVIVNEKSDQFTATGPTGSDYSWQVANGLGTFTNRTSNKTKFIASKEALNQGRIDISVLIDNTEKTIEDIEVLSNDSKTEYAKGSFHSIVSTDDMNRKGYLAAGTVGDLNSSNSRHPYMVKADNRGVTIEKKEFNREGRFYEVKDFVRTARGDYYYLIGYGTVNGDVSQEFVLELNNKMVINKDYNSGGITTGDTYLRSGIISKNIFASDHVIAVGNTRLDNGNLAPYIIDINTNDAADVTPHILDNDYGYEFANSYYNLESIVEINNGYIAVGFTGANRSGAEGIILRLNSEFNVTEVNTSITEKLFKIKKVKNVTGVDYVVVGDNGYIGEIDDNSSNLTITSDNIGTARYRDVLVDGSNYIVVGAKDSNNDDKYDQGVVSKLTAGSLANSDSFTQNYGSYLYSVDKATDGDYLLAGHSTSNDGSTNSYVVKINPSDGSVVDRVKE